MDMDSAAVDGPNTFHVHVEERMQRQCAECMQHMHRRV